MGIRGLPARHGGFETFAQFLAPYLRDRGWSVTVYCQEEGHEEIRESMWNGIRRVHIAVGSDTPMATIKFDWACISHAIQDRPSLVLTLGYNTAVFSLRLRLAGIPNVFNMDGIEWSRDKWSLPERAWLYVNDWAGCLLGTHLIADHPEIARHLGSRVAPRKITTIPYGSEPIQHAAPANLEHLGLEAYRFVTVIARPEPENSILDIVRAFSRKKRGIRLVVLGKLVASVPYHSQVMDAASEEVLFPGAIYDPAIVKALRRYSLLYVHGHRAGGTNPSLLEAMGAGNAVLAHNNRFNRWVAGEGALYFDDAESCAAAMERLFSSQEEMNRLKQASEARARETFNWTDVLREYHALLSDVHVWAHGRPSWPRPRTAPDVEDDAR